MTPLEEVQQMLKDIKSTIFTIENTDNEYFDYTDLMSLYYKSIELASVALKKASEL